MTILFTALALAASAVFFYQITRPTSFLSAIMQVEVSRLMPNWQTMIRQYDDRLRAEPVTKQHVAVARLMRGVIDLDHTNDKTQAAKSVSELRSWFESDRNNLISRLAFGAILEASSNVNSPVERFDQWKAIVEPQTGTIISALYNRDFETILNDVLGGYVYRADVRANMIKYYGPERFYVIADHYAALPIIQQRLTKLADKLSAAGKASEAEACRRWVVRACLGLMEYEPDAGTRLLCADLAARCLPTEDPLQASMVKLIRDFKYLATRCPADLSSIQRTFAMSSDVGADVMSRLFAAGAYGLEAVGCAILILGLCIATIFQKRTAAATAQPFNQYPSRSGFFPAMSFPILIMLQTLMMGNSRSSAHFSEGLLYWWSLWVMALATTTVFFASYFANGHAQTRARRLAAGLVWGLALFACHAPAVWVASLHRWVDLHLGGLPTIAGALLVSMIFLIRFRAAPLAWIARVASMMWLACACCGLCALLALSITDQTWQEKTMTGRRDEFAARLGADWQQRFRMPSADAYALPTTTKAP